jgi:hypothetical protein
MKYLTGLLQSLAVLTSPGNVSTARRCNNPVKYFTVKKFASLAIISQNPGFIEIQVFGIGLYLYCTLTWIWKLGIFFLVD